MKHFLLSALFLLFSVSLFSQNYKKVKIFVSTESDLKSLYSAGIEIDHFSQTKDKAIEIFVSDEEFARLQASGFQYQVLIDDWYGYYEKLPKLSEAEKESFRNSSRSNYGVEGFKFGSMGGYYTFNEIVADLDSMYLQFPNLITQKYSIGTSHEGRTIWAVKISDNPNVSENEPQAGFDALIHAREPQSMATVMYFMWYLLENYGTDPLATYLVNNREIFFVPCYNPDGYEQNRQTNPNGGGMWRKNRRNNGTSFGVDLNRNYGYMWGYDNSGSSPTPSSETYRGPSAFSEPEAQAVRDLIQSKNINTYMNMHSWQNAYLYPWGYIDLACPDAPTYLEYSADMSAFNGFVYGTGSQVLGYNSNGSARDWLYGEQTAKNKIFGYTMEIGNSSDSFWPLQSRIFPIAQENLGANMYNAMVAGEYVTLHDPNFGQQYFNPGDVLNFTPYFRNKGLASAYNLSAQLSSASPYVTIAANSAQFDSIEARSTAQAASALSFTISSSAPVEEEIKLVFKTYTNSDVMSIDTVSFIIGVPTYTFIDTTNNPENLWTITATPSTPKWEATETAFYSSPNSYTDSKTGNYAPNATVIMQTTNPIDLTGTNFPKLSFWTKFDIESNWDYGQVEISTNNGSTWTPLQGLYTEPGQGSFQPNGQPVYDGIQNSWVREEISLSQFAGNQVKLRFKLRTDGAVHKDGWYLDDIGIFVYTIVPVELNSFTAEEISGGVKLSWETSTETNNKGFEVSRLIESGWQAVAFVDGNGTTTEKQNYSFTDKNLSQGKAQYRLKQIDFDGTYRIYGPVEVEVSGVTDFALEQNFPNPFNPKTNFEFRISNFEFVTLKIFDILGNEVATLVNEVKEPGKYEVEFNAKNLSSGTYFYTLKAGSFTSTKKLMVIK